MSRSRWLIALGMVSGLAGPLEAQGPLDAAVDRARQAWLAHEVRALVATSDTVRLRIPEVAAAQSLRPAQAARILGSYLADARELAFTLREIRHVADDHAYAEFVRRYVVDGTADELEQAVFFGFRRVDGAWRLREVRVTP